MHPADGIAAIAPVQPRLTIWSMTVQQAIVVLVLTALLATLAAVLTAYLIAG